MRGPHSHVPSNKCSQDTPELKLTRSGRSAALSGLRVICLKPNCRDGSVGRSLDGVLGDVALRSHICSGNRPWLQDREACARPIRALMRGASNVYFAVTASALSIPPNSSACKQGVADVWHLLKPMFDQVTLDKLSPTDVVGIVMNMNGQLRRFTHDQIWTAVQELADPDENAELHAPVTSDEQRVLKRPRLSKGVRTKTCRECPFSKPNVFRQKRFRGTLHL